jgi:hypothetical protein
MAHQSKINHCQKRNGDIRYYIWNSKPEDTAIQHYIDFIEEYKDEGFFLQNKRQIKMLKYLNKNIITFAEVLNKILSGFFYTIKGFLQAGLPPGPIYNDFKSLTSYTFIIHKACNQYK